MSESAIATQVREFSALELLDKSTEGQITYVFSMKKPDETNRAEVLTYARAITRMMSKCNYRASEVFGQKINMVHVFGHPVKVRNVDEQTGEVTYVDADRVVLLDDEGNTYEAVSAGLLQSLTILFRLPGIGFPQDWTEPLPITIRSVSVRNTWHTFKIEVWEEPKPKGEKK